MGEKYLPSPRPCLHATSPLGWMNDPCAPCYDPNTQSYHLFYQCNPNGVEWGNISWGHTTSKDMVRWRFGTQHTKLKPDEKYDKDGVFTGCMAPVGSDGTMTLFYTSICQLPFHWTNPAPRGSAGLAMATSMDGGETWTKSGLNPILEAEPGDLHVTGFRDPYLAEWEAMDNIRGGKKTLYGLISGGIQGVGPTTFIYAVDPMNLAQWEYLGPLVEISTRFQPCQKWSCNYGVNWECVNFMTLKSEVASRDFLILGSEGDVERAHLLSSPSRSTAALQPRVVRAQQWMAGTLVKRGSDVRMRYDFGGILDHGSYYAANSFWDPKTTRRIVFGWIPEDDCTVKFAKKKGWNGCQALPRELFLYTLRNVTKGLHSSLADISCVQVESQPDDSNTLYTLGIRPIAEFDVLRQTAVTTVQRQQIRFSPSPSAPKQPHQPLIQHEQITTVRHAAWQLNSTISLPETHESLTKIRSVGFHIRAAPDHDPTTSSSSSSTHTSILFHIHDETIKVDREFSVPPELATAPNGTGIFNVLPEQGPFTLFTFKQSTTNLDRNPNPNQDPDSDTNANTNVNANADVQLPTPTTQETLNLSVICDGDVLEVFANDRFALATMVYTGNPTYYGAISAVVEFQDESSLSVDQVEDRFEIGRESSGHESMGSVSVCFEDVTVWDGLGRGEQWVGVMSLQREDGSESQSENEGEGEGEGEGDERR